MQSKGLNNPESGVQESFVEFVNKSGGALAHGDIVIMDLANSSIEAGTTTTTANSPRILGVVFDARGVGVADNARGVLMVKGLHPAVNVNSAVYSAGQALVSATVAKKAAAQTLTAAYTVNFFALVAQTYTAARTAIAARLCVK